MYLLTASERFIKFSIELIDDNQRESDEEISAISIRASVDDLHWAWSLLSLRGISYLKRSERSYEVGFGDGDIWNTDSGRQGIFDYTTLRLLQVVM